MDGKPAGRKSPFDITWPCGAPSQLRNAISFLCIKTYDAIYFPQQTHCAESAAKAHRSLVMDAKPSRHELAL
jgi:hypothetical protein